MALCNYIAKQYKIESQIWNVLIRNANMNGE